MKRWYALMLVLTVLFVGCGSNRDKPTAISSKNIAKESEVIKDKPDESENSMDVSLKSLEPYYSRKPSAPDYTYMKKKLNSLSETNLWGPYLDLRQEDLSLLDLTNDFDHLMNICYDTDTIWSDKLPEGFDPEFIMEQGKNPGLGIRSLHAKGITGKGVGIAIIDYPLLVEHEEYFDQIKLYDEYHVSESASMHGPFVASICTGKSVGVAPEANLYFIGTDNKNENGDIDYTYFAKSIDMALDINKRLPENHKIRVLSISAAWCPENAGYQEMTEAIERAKKDGIFVISCNLFENYGFWTYSLDKLLITESDDPKAYFPFDWESWIAMVSNVPGFSSYYEKKFAESFHSQLLLIPIASRTYASATNSEDYAFHRSGGWSLMEPYLAGLYAMACQVHPDITPEEFWDTALKTGEAREISRENNKYEARMLNPVALIENLQE